MLRPDRFWFWWLVGASLVVVAFGAALVVLPSQMQVVFDTLFFGSPSGTAAFRPATQYLEFAFAVLGSVMAGWGVCILLILFGSFRRGSPEAWNAVAGSLVVWFVADTTASLVSGFWQNAVLNGVLGILFLLPLAQTRPSRGEATGSAGAQRNAG